MSRKTMHGLPGIYNATDLSLTDEDGVALATDSRGRLLQSTENYSSYEAKTFTISGAQTNYNIATSQTMFATPVRQISVYSDVASTVKLNATGNDGIVLAAGEEITIQGLLVSNVFVTTSGNTVIRIVALR
jgi:hypothetical protein